MPEPDGPQFKEGGGQGQCFPYCHLRAMTAGDEDIKIVHGRVSQPATIDPGKMNRPHGWVVQGGVVQDWQTMEQEGGGGKFHGIGWPEELFNEAFSPEVDYEFTPKELTTIIGATKTSGPFTPEEVQKHLGR